jgi:hypothetical protein
LPVPPVTTPWAAPLSSATWLIGGPGGLLQLVRYDGRVLWSRRRSGLAFVMRADRVVYVVGSELVGVGRGGRPRR